MPTERKERGVRRRARKAAATAAPIALALTLVVAPQLFAGEPGWAITLITLASAAACALAVWTAREEKAAVPLGGVWLVFVAGLAWTLLQGIPLPLELTRWLQPEAAAMAERTAELLRAPAPSFLPISISPAGTRAEIVKGSALACAFGAAWILAALGHRERVVMAVGVSCVAMAVVALGHLASGTDHVWGALQTPSPLPAPLSNPNQLSGFLAMGVCALASLGLGAEARGPRVAWLTGAALVTATSLLAVSRGGVASLVAGLLMLGLLTLLRRRAREGGAATPLVILGGTAAFGAGLALYTGAQALYGDFERGDYSKLTLAWQGLELGLTHPLVGVGRGAFSAAFVQRHGTDLRFTHPESWPAQWSAEWGLPLAIALAAVLLVALARSARQAHRWAQLGALAGVASLGLHDLVDFASERLGVGVVAAALLAAAIAPGRRASAPSSRRSALPLGVSLSAAALLACAALGWRIEGERVPTLQRRLEAAVQSATFDEALVAEAVRLHPAEPTFPLLAGAAAVRRNEPRALGWLNRAMVLAPGWSAPHVEAAHFLARRGRRLQALLELREAEEIRRGTGTDLACWMLQNGARAEDLERAARADATGLAWLDAVAGCLPFDSQAAVALDAHLTEHGVQGAALRDARRALAAGDAERALAALAGLPDDTTVLLARARAHLRAGRPS
ncbi:MAG: hypothetical protein IT378_07470, partial [Sandaracinaceae bacterium]|nr:hypothetical protein [Sandaracinaceae bacterium]